MTMECDRMYVMTTWAGDNTSMPIQMWQNIQVGRTQAFPKSPKHKKPLVNRPSCLGPCPSQVRRARTRHAIPFASFYNNIILSYSIGRADGHGMDMVLRTTRQTIYIHTYARDNRIQNAPASHISVMMLMSGLQQRRVKWIGPPVLGRVG